MTFQTILDAILLGVIEGATEYLPVSSTGHLIVAVDLLGFIGPPGKIFEIVIQVGAVLAVCILYFQRLLGTVIDFPTDPRARTFVYSIVLAFLPAAFIGVLLHKTIKAYLFNPTVVAIALIVGGIAILVIERVRPVPRVRHIEEFSLPLALGIGFMQCLAMIPGVSRSGATILGALLLGVERKTAAEFSFFLAIPTLTGAAVYDLWANRATLTTDGIGVIAWYRIAFGALILGILYLR